MLRMLLAKAIGEPAGGSLAKSEGNILRERDGWGETHSQSSVEMKVIQVSAEPITTWVYPEITDT